MNIRTIERICGAGLVTISLPDLYAAQWGSLWQPGNVEYLGWSQLYVLRPGLYFFGVAALGLGLWHAWLKWTTFGSVMRNFNDAIAIDREIDSLYRDSAEGYAPNNWRHELGFAWHLLTHCALGFHDPIALWYSDGGESGSRGTRCADCGVMVSLANVTPPSEDEYQRMEIVMSDWPVLDGDGGPDPLRYLEPGCESRFTHGSDPAIRCAKES